MLLNFTFYILIGIVFIVLFSKQHYVIAKPGLIVFVLGAVLWLWVVLAFRESRGDPYRYMIGLNDIAQLNFIEFIAYDKVPFFFGLINWLTASISTSSEFFFSVVYVFCVVPLYLAFRERFGKTDAAVLMMLYLLYPFYLNYLSSGFKQGIGFGFMMWGLTCFLDMDEPKLIKGIILTIVATLFHTSFAIVLAVIFSWNFFFRKRSLLWVFSLLFLSFILALSGMGESIVTAILPQKIIDSLGFSEYFDDTFTSDEHFASLQYVSGFRIDFSLFTLLPLSGMVYLRNRDELVKNDDLLKIYSLLASVYFLLCFIPFSDRIASFSWFLIPYMLYFYTQSERFFYLRYYSVIVIIASYAVLMLTYTKGVFQ